MTDSSTNMEPSRDIIRLIEIMAALRTPVTGCPWDLAQSFETIAPYTIEEAYEVADAIDRRDLTTLAFSVPGVGLILFCELYHGQWTDTAPRGVPSSRRTWMATAPRRDCTVMTSPASSPSAAKSAPHKEAVAMGSMASNTTARRVMLPVCQCSSCRPVISTKG